MLINDLPTEMLDEILGDAIHHFYRPTIGSRELMGVCRRWHDIIVSTPKFWIDVWVLVEENGRVPFDWILRQLATELARCQRALIDVTWKVRQSETQARRLMDTIGEYTSFDRWRSLYVVYHDGDVPDIETSLSLLGVFRSFQTLQIGSCPSRWFLDYINSTLPPDAPLRELRCFSLDILNSNNPGELSHIMHTISKLRSSYLDVTSIPTTTWSGLFPANITDLTIEHLPSTTGLNFSHLKKLCIEDYVSAGELELNDCSGLTMLDIAFDDVVPMGRLVFPVLLELRIHGGHHHILADIDAPRLQVLVTGEGDPWVPQLARCSLEDAVKQQKYALQPTRELEIRFIVSPQTIQILLDRSPALEKLTVHMAGETRDREVLRLLLFRSTTMKDEGDEKGNGSEDERDVERETRQHDIPPSDEGDIVKKPRGQNLYSLTIILEPGLTDEDLATWEECLRGFEDSVKRGKGGESNARFRCLRGKS